MHKMTITYKDFNDTERIEDVYFNLTKSELLEFALDLPDNVSDSIKDEADKMDEQKAVTKIMSSFNSKGVLKFIKDLILKSYGVRKDEGRRFAKTDENGNPLSVQFAETMAYEVIMEKFLTDDVAAAEFVNAVIPASVAKDMPNVQNVRQGISTNK